MGLFKRKNTDNNRNENQNTVTNERNTPDMKCEMMSNGNLKIDFYDSKSDFSKFYDTTRLVIGREPLSINGHRVYNCAVSWYGKNDCQYLNKRTGRAESLRAADVKGVLMEIDLDLLQKDYDYCNVVMKGLLNQNRVEKYLKAGLEENPEIPCGKYIGGIIRKDGQYKKAFSRDVGWHSHYSPLMVNRRIEKAKKEEAKRNAKIAELKEEIKSLEQEGTTR